MVLELPIGVVQQVMGRYAGRPVRNANFSTGEDTKTQSYKAGPYVWCVFLQVGLGAQVCVGKLRDSNKIRVWSEARRSAKTGTRLTPTDKEEKAAANLASLVEAALDSFAPTREELMEAL